MGRADWRTSVRHTETGPDRATPSSQSDAIQAFTLGEYLDEKQNRKVQGYAPSNSTFLQDAGRRPWRSSSPMPVRKSPRGATAARVVVGATAPRRTNSCSGRPRASAARSSARSGDGPSDAGPSEPPPPARLWLRRHSEFGLATPNLLNVLLAGRPS